jgi:superfamily I DNA and/or RNA helicase
MQKVTIKQLAEYCRDYIDLVSPSVMSRGGKRVRLPADVFSAEPLLKNVAEINYDDQVILPINLTTKLSDLSIESEEADNESDETVGRDLAIARDLDDVYRKFETNTYTKQLSLQFGHISFKGIPNFGEEDDELEESGHKQAEGYLFSVPIVLSYKDSSGQRTYDVRIDDTLIKTNISFVKNYMKLEYRDELYKFVALDADDENSGIPMSPSYVDELWTKISEYLRYSDAIDISENPDMSDVIIALEPKANYFLSQDLSGIIQAADDDVLGETSLAAWVDKEEQYVTEPIDDTGEHELFFPFAYDKYQLQVLSKINNKGMIVEGPPGTGKSQTISNILVHLAATGKKVLFVSQKDQAVRGVKDKLKSLNIPYLFGYMPDRSSRLHTDEDEMDSATYALRGISQSYLDNIAEQDPKTFLAQIATEVPSFNSSIDESRAFVQKYNEWSSLDEFDFGTNSTKITADWYGKIQELRKNIEAIKRQISKQQNESDGISQKIEGAKQSQEVIKAKIKKVNQSFQEVYDYQWLQNEREYIHGIGYEMLANLTRETIVSFETTVLDRRVNIISAKLNEFKLSKELDRTLRQLPFELYETYKTIIFSNHTKTERRLVLEKIENYFSSKARLQVELSKAAEKIKQLEEEQTALLRDLATSESALGDLNVQLSSELLDDISMERFEGLYAICKTSLFDKIRRRYELDTEVKSQIILNPNLVHEEIMREKQEYDSQVKNYIRNRIAERARTYRSQKQYRSALEGIAWKLSKTKKAYKTFDRLKSDPFNFEAMSAVTPIWMMGLDDASRILPLQPNLFDYVIVDEASQCNISYTLPVMYRAKHAIFFGDTLQMRDTTIAFKSNNQLMSLAHKHSIPEDLQIKAEGDSVKSVMDIAKLNGFESTILMKHYRSPIELIGFSNENFYAPKNRRLEVVNDDILATEDGRVLKTHLIQANPTAEISSKSNLSEAYYIKQLIGKIKSDERTKGKSIAVLSFFNEQAELLRRVIPDEDVKISAIEGIQGDERDIVIYSFVITSPNDKRRYTALTGEYGEIRKEINEGRVNVAFSRAKLQVHAVTSLAPNLWPDGIWIKKYLEYIEEHGRVNRLAKAEQHFDSHFEEKVYDYLMQKLDLSEYRVSTQVESCGFKIDQVITNVKTGNKLAIECDGPTHFDDGDGQVRVESDFERQFVLETAHWIFYRISYIDWQRRQESAKKDLIDVIIDHFSNREKPKIAETTTDLEEVRYEAISVEIPESVINEQKERAVSAPTRGYFGRQVAAKKPDESRITKDQCELFANSTEIPTVVTSSERKITSDQKIHTDRSTTSSENSFSQIGEVQLGSCRSIVISSRGDDSYWFNEKVNDPNYSGFTQKGFGLKANDWNDFKAALANISSDSSAQERRFKINDSTELVVYHPSSDTVDIRQYVTSAKYTGWTKKGIRVTNENAKKIVEQLSSVG